MSFQAACSILGIKSSEIRDSSTSSERKGESIEDSLRKAGIAVDHTVARLKRYNAVLRRLWCSARTCVAWRGLYAPR